MTDLIKVKTDTAANWASNNPVLADQEPGYDSTNRILKIGNGATAWAALSGLSFGAITDADVAAVAPNDQTGTTYTYVLADKHRLVTGNNASAQTHTIPPNSSVAFPLGTALQLYQKGAGQITIAAGAGVTIRTPHGAKTNVQYAVVTMIQVLADVWVITGDTTT